MTTNCGNQITIGATLCGVCVSWDVYSAILCSLKSCWTPELQCCYEGTACFGITLTITLNGPIKLDLKNIIYLLKWLVFSAE